jgi:hypothetical protein
VLRLGRLIRRDRGSNRLGRRGRRGRRGRAGRLQAGRGLLHPLLRLGDRGGGAFLGEVFGAGGDALLLQQLTVARGGAVEAVGVAAEAQGELRREVVVQRLAERGRVASSKAMRVAAVIREMALRVR